MAKIPVPRFTFKSPNADRSLVYLIYRYRGNKLRYSTQVTIDACDWNPRTQRPIDKERRPDLWKMRKIVDNIAEHTKDVYIQNDYGTLSKDEFKKQLDIRLGRIEPPKQKKTKKPPTLFKFIEQEIEEMEATGMKRGALKIFKVHGAKLKAFADEKGKFDFKDVNWTLRLKLIDWLASKNAQLAYGNKTLNILRQFMERARRKGFHNCTGYQGQGWRVRALKADSVRVTLSVDELQRLADMQLRGYLKKVRDLLLVGVGSGQRFGDFSQITPKDFYTTTNGVKLLSVISQKTGTPAKIPLNFFPWLIPVLEEYDYHAPKLSMQKFNDGLKTLCERAGFDESVLVVEQYIGRKARLKRLYKPKYEVISSHTCRRSFATNLYRMGYKLSQIMPMTGHSTESQLRIYIGIDAEENAEQIAMEILERNQ